MNVITLTGRIAKDIEVKYANGTSTPTARLRIAVRRAFKGADGIDTDFFTVTIFGKTAEFVQNYMKKGDVVEIRAHLRNDNYTDKNGVKHYENAIISDEVNFGINNKQSDDGATPTAESKSNPAPATSAEKAKRSKPAPQVPDDIDEELPFA